MVFVDKFFIFGGGRWREVDTASGRIEGWGRARFVTARGGKLQAARARPVLAALRALACRQPSAAKEGLRLPHSYPASAERPARAPCRHCQCCHHSNMRSSCNSNPAENKASIAVQCDKVDPAALTSDRDNLPRDSSKRKRDSTSSEDLFHKKVITVATVHSPKIPDPKRLRTTSSSKSPKKVGLKRKRQISASSEDRRALATLRSSKKSPSLKQRRPGPLRQKQRGPSKDTSPVLQSKVSDEVSQDNVSKPKSKKVKRDETSSSENLPRRSTRQNTSIVISSDESDSETNLKSVRQKISRRRSSSADTHKNKPPKTAVERSSTDEPAKVGPKKATKSSADLSNKHKIGPKRNLKKSSIEPIKYKAGPKKALASHSQNTQSGENGLQIQSQDSAKELLIDESDVHILRLFLQKHYPDEELLRFDTDDEYKMMHFYQINPLVSVERCPRIARMIRADSQLSLVDFASKLGLRSVSEASSAKPKRYKTRRRGEKSVDGGNASRSEHTDTDAEKENIDRPLTSRRKQTAVLRESLKRNKQRGVRKDREGDKRERDNTMDTVELSSESEAEQVKSLKKTEVVKPKPKKAKPKVVTSSKRATLKEYSNLEDHAIVSWVSVGARASSVNGNRLWRQLQEQFPRLVGHGRTWHSLRNRYLRYILPRLGALALPHAQQARLRAAAATGELKARRKEPRRNSIFTLPPRGASSRRPAAPRGAGGEEDSAGEQKKRDRTKPIDKGKENAGSPPAGRARSPRAPAPRAPSPRYSDVTRQLLRRRRRGQGSASSRRSAGRSPARAPTDRSPSGAKRSRSPRRNSPSESDRRGSSDESRGTAKRRSVSSDSSSDDSLSASPSESSGREAPIEPNRRRSNRLNSPSESNRLNSFGESNRRRSARRASPTESNRKSNGRNSPSEPSRRRSNRRNSPLESNKPRHDSPSESNGRRSSRRASPTESNRLKPSRTNSSSETNNRKSIRNISPNKNCRNDSPRRRSHRHRSPGISKRTIQSSKSNNDSSPSRQLRSERTTDPAPVRPRTRKLFNPRQVW